MVVLEREDRARARGATRLRDDRRLRLDLRRLPPRADGSRRRADRPRDAAGDRAIRPPDRGDRLRQLSRHVDDPQRRRSNRAACAQLFGRAPTRIAGSSTKSMIGHPQGASGAAGIVTTALAMANGFLPPTINLDDPDPECDISTSSRTRAGGRARRRRALQLPRLRLEEQRDRARRAAPGQLIASRLDLMMLSALPVLSRRLRRVNRKASERRERATRTERGLQGPPRESV